MTLHKKPPFRAKGLTLLEFSIALTLVVVVVGAAVSQWSNDKQQATDMIAQLQLARTGMLRFNMDYPCSTRALSALVKREDTQLGSCGDTNDPQSWKGPYIELTNQLISSRDLNVSSIYPESRLTLREATVGNVQYQAIILEGSASSNLRAAILAQCGEDCMPIPGSDDLGILVHQSQPAAVQSSELVTQVATPRPAWIPMPPPPPPPPPPPTPTPPTPPQSETNSYGVTYIPSSPTNGFIRLAHCTEYRLENMTTGQVQYIARSNDYQLNLIEWNQGIRVTIEQRGICGS